MKQCRQCRYYVYTGGGSDGTFPRHICRHGDVEYTGYPVSTALARSAEGQCTPNAFLWEAIPIKPVRGSWWMRLMGSTS